MDIVSSDEPKWLVGRGGHRWKKSSPAGGPSKHQRRCWEELQTGQQDCTSGLRHQWHPGSSHEVQLSTQETEFLSQLSRQELVPCGETFLVPSSWEWRVRLAGEGVRLTWLAWEGQTHSDVKMLMLKMKIVFYTTNLRIEGNWVEFLPTKMLLSFSILFSLELCWWQVTSHSVREDKVTLHGNILDMKVEMPGVVYNT